MRCSLSRDERGGSLPERDGAGRRRVLTVCGDCPWCLRGRSGEAITRDRRLARELGDDVTESLGSQEYIYRKYSVSGAGLRRLICGLFQDTVGGPPRMPGVTGIASAHAICPSKPSVFAMAR